jgi:hypothetical protein
MMSAEEEAEARLHDLFPGCRVRRMTPEEKAEALHDLFPGFRASMEQLDALVAEREKSAPERLAKKAARRKAGLKAAATRRRRSRERAEALAAGIVLAEPVKPSKSAKRPSPAQQRQALSLQLERDRWAAMPADERVSRAEREARADYAFQRQALERRGLFDAVADAANIERLQVHYRDRAGVELSAEAIRTPLEPVTKKRRPKSAGRKPPPWRPGDRLPFEPMGPAEVRKACSASSRQHHS